MNTPLIIPSSDITMGPKLNRTVDPLVNKICRNTVNRINQINGFTPLIKKDNLISDNFNARNTNKAKIR